MKLTSYDEYTKMFAHPLAERAYLWFSLIENNLHMGRTFIRHEDLDGSLADDILEHIVSSYAAVGWDVSYRYEQGSNEHKFTLEPLPRSRQVSQALAQAAAKLRPQCPKCGSERGVSSFCAVSRGGVAVPCHCCSKCRSICRAATEGY